MRRYSQALLFYLLATTCCLVELANSKTDSGGPGFVETRVSQIGLTLSLPLGWKAVPASTLEKQTADVRARAPKVAYRGATAGYQPADYPPDSLTFPYIMVQVQPSRTPTPDELREAATKLNSQEGAKAVSQKGEGVFTDEGSQLSYDAATNTLNGTMIAKMDGNRIAIYTRLIATNSGTVALNGYYETADRIAATNFFQPIFDTARLDASAQPQGKLGWKNFNLEKILLAALIGAISAGFWGRKKKKPAPPPLAEPASTLGEHMFCTQCGTEISKDAKFCDSCGKRLQQAQPVSPPTVYPSTFRYIQKPTEEPVFSQPAPHQPATNPSSGANVGYANYGAVPFYRKQWFFWLMYFTISPVAILILLFGDVYYERNGEVKSFGTANRVVAGAIAVFILYRITSIFISNGS